MPYYCTDLDVNILRKLNNNMSVGPKMGFTFVL